MNMLLAISLLLLLSGVESDTGCESGGTGNSVLYLGWPHMVTCEVYIDSLYYDYGEATACVIKDGLNGRVLLNCSETELDSCEYDFGEVTENTTTSLEIVITDDVGACHSWKANYTIQPFPNTTCQEYINSPWTSSTFPTEENTPKKLSCDLPEGTPGDVEIIWQRNCISFPGPADSTAFVNEEKKLDIGQVNHAVHPGIYSCAAKYKGLVRYIWRTNLCIKPPSLKDQITVRCPKEQSLEIGDNVDVTCTVDVGRVRSPDDYVMTFNHKILNNGTPDPLYDNISCTSSLDRPATTAPDKRVSCSFQYENGTQEEPKCFDRIPTPEEWDYELNRTTKLTISYKLENIRHGEFGTLQALVRQGGSLHIRDTQNITISEDTEHPENKAAIIGISIGVLLFLILLIGILFLMRIELRWMWHHHFAECHKVLRPYDAYLAYYWSNSPGEHVGHENYQGLIERIRKQLGKIGCKYYDNSEEIGISSLQFDNISQMQMRCERTIIILTPEYIRQDQSTFEIYQSYLDLKGLIFIETPGSREAIIRLPEQSKSGLLTALRQHHVLKWTGGRGKLPRRFRMQLEVLMPKRANNAKIDEENRAEPNQRYANGTINRDQDYEVAYCAGNNGIETNFYENDHYQNGNGALNGHGNGYFNGGFHNTRA